MEPNFLKELDSDTNRAGLVKPKRKLAASDVASVSFPCRRRKLNGCGDFTDSFSPFQRTIVRYYLNFMKSKIPQRVMFHENSRWIDFPQTVVCVVQDEFRVKKAIFEVHCGGLHYLLDFLHMCQVDIKTSSQQPIAWIDEAGDCFFPELSANEKCQHLSAENQDFLSHELKLQIEVDLSGIYNTKGECSGESDTPNKKPRNAINHMLMEHEDNKDLDSKVHGTPAFESLDFDTVLKMLKPVDGLECVGIYACTGVGMQDRLEMFLKQVDITKKCRGDANVRYAWLATSEKAISTLTTCGISFYELPTIEPIFGSGIQLADVNSSHSARFCEIDEKGIRHMLLCRVILGSMELVEAGSTQCHPSSEVFDSGVDDLQNPTRYVVWTMNMTTHILPECVVSFKIPSIAEGNIIGDQLPVTVTGASGVKRTKVDVKMDASATHSGHSSNHVFDNSITLHKAPSMGSDAPKAPRSPWMPFPMLLDAISDRINPKDMGIIKGQYASFKAQQISRDDFVKNLRSVAGDHLLRSTITRLQCKVPGRHVKGIARKRW